MLAFDNDHRERFKKLTKQVKDKEKAIRELESTPPAQIWANDLDELEKALVRVDPTCVYKHSMLLRHCVRYLS